MVMEKEWYRSKTVWGALVALAATIAGMMGVEVSGEAHEAATAALTDAAAAIGALVALAGRFAATGAIR